MKAIRQYVDAERLSTVIALPESLRNQKLEVIVLPVPKQVPKMRTATFSSFIAWLYDSTSDSTPSTSLLSEELLSKIQKDLRLQNEMQKNRTSD